MGEAVLESGAATKTHFASGDSQVLFATARSNMRGRHRRHTISCSKKTYPLLSRGPPDSARVAQRSRAVHPTMYSTAFVPGSHSMDIRTPFPIPALSAADAAVHRMSPRDKWPTRGWDSNSDQIGRCHRNHQTTRKLLFSYLPMKARRD